MKIHIELDAFDTEGIQRTISTLQKLVGQTPESEPDENPEPAAEKAPEKKTPAKRRSRKSTPKKQTEKPEEPAAEEPAAEEPAAEEDVTEAIKAIMPRLIKAGKRKDLTDKVQEIGCKLSDMNDKQKAEMLAFMHTLDA